MTLDELEPRLREVLGRRAGLRFAFVFGSAVSRGIDSARDLDIALETSQPLSLLERGSLARELEEVAGREVDIVDIATASTLLRWEILSTGRLLLSADERALLDFRVRTPIEWADLRPYLEREAAGLRRALGV